MLFQLLTADELYGLLDRLGYRHDRQTIPRTVGYYLDRTCHGSTLSRVVHSWVLARSARRKAWGWFLEALESDIADVQGGTTGEGVHLGAMAGTVDLLQRAFTGMETREDVLWFDPALPEALDALRFRIRYRRHPEIEVRIDHAALTVGGAGRAIAPLPLRVRDTEYRLDPRGALEVPLQRHHG
jgi:trehalose/maltose hydrolase-like predicted phosphorylase